MEKLFTNYYWKNGRPQGSSIATPGDPGVAIKIVADPYFKHISIEEYKDGRFQRLIYDSRLLDFRSLRSQIPPVWNKEEEAEQTVIRDQNDRVTWIEKYVFEKGLCIECRVFSPHGILLSVHKIYYSAKGDPFDGVELYDSNGKLVMYKRYALNDEGEFGDLLEENWEEVPKKKK